MIKHALSLLLLLASIPAKGMEGPLLIVETLGYDKEENKIHAVGMDTNFLITYVTKNLQKGAFKSKAMDIEKKNDPKPDEKTVEYLKSEIARKEVQVLWYAVKWAHEYVDYNKQEHTICAKISKDGWHSAMQLTKNLKTGKFVGLQKGYYSHYEALLPERERVYLENLIAVKETELLKQPVMLNLMLLTELPYANADIPTAKEPNQKKDIAEGVDDDPENNAISAWYSDDLGIITMVIKDLKTGLFDNSSFIITDPKNSKQDVPVQINQRAKRYLQCKINRILGERQNQKLLAELPYASPDSPIKIIDIPFKEIPDRR